MVRGTDVAIRATRNGGVLGWSSSLEQYLVRLSTQLRYVQSASMPSNAPDSMKDGETLGSGVKEETVVLPKQGVSDTPSSGPRRFTYPQGKPGSASGTSRIGHTSRHQPPTPWLLDVDTMVSRLATEALQEVERLKQVNGLANEETRKMVWQVMRLFREIVRDQNERPEQTLPSAGKLGWSRNREETNKLNDTIHELYVSTKAELESLSANEPVAPEEVKRIVGALMNTYKETLEKSETVLNAASVTTMLHRTATLVTLHSLQNWMIKSNPEYIKVLAGEVSKRLGMFDPQGYATVVWSFGKLGPGLRTVDLGYKKFDRLMEDLMEVSRKDTNRFSIHDCMNIILGFAELGANQHASWAYLRGLTRVLASGVSDLKPADMSALLWAFAKLKYTQAGELVSKMCIVAEHQLDQFEPHMLSSFLRGLVIVDHQGTPRLVKKSLAILEERVLELDLQALSKAVWALLLLSYHPGEAMMQRLGDLVCSQSENLDHHVVTATILAMAHCGEAHGEALHVAKKHFVENAAQYRVSDTCKLLWSLSMLDAMDSDVFKAVERSPLGGLACNHYGVESRRQLCQILISWRILNNEAPPAFVSRELEEACYTAWKAVQRTKTSFGLMPEVVNMFKQAGFACRSPMLIEKIPLSVTSAIREKSDDKEELKLALEVATRSQSYYNRPALQKARQRWRHRILEASGWKVVQITVDKWNKLMTEDEKIEHLRRIVHEQASEYIDFPTSSTPSGEASGASSGSEGLDPGTRADASDLSVDVDGETENESNFEDSRKISTQKAALRLDISSDSEDLLLEDMETDIGQVTKEDMSKVYSE